MLSLELLAHLEAEEKRVFPLIRKIFDTRMQGKSVSKKLADSLREEVDLMVDDHDGAGDVMKELRELSTLFHKYDDVFMVLNL
ncbi:hypothetical protein BH23BAC3_BH23BAC3_33240 [soil metagenome]